MPASGKHTLIHKLVLIGLFCTSPAGVWAQEESTGQVMEEVIITSTRIEESLIEIPAAIGVLNKDEIQKGRQLLGLDESLNRIPGVFSQNRYNFANDLRIAIRGFGARANFGIRGIKVFIDNIPSTLADGQTGVDDIDLGSTERAEVIRGPSSSLYGPSSGGVISLFTEEGTETPFVQGTITLGEYDQQKYQIKTGGQYQRLNYLINFSSLDMDGYREHAEVEHTQLNSKFRYDIDDDSNLTLTVSAVDSPVANEPGGLSEQQANTDPQQANPRNLISNAGEDLDQQKIGIVYNKTFNDQHRITLRNYYLWRDFELFLPFGTHVPPPVPDDGVVNFDRFFYGGGAQYIYTGILFGKPNRFTAGFDIDIQEDDRQRYLNDSGIKGALSFDQLEEAESYGFYMRNEINLLDTLTLTLGLRYDILDMSVDDYFLGNEDQSSELDFDEFSHTVGLSWNVHEDIYLYANYATSFETPTFTELATAARDDDFNVNLGGFNNVTAQTADSFEAGAKGALYDGRVYFDLAAFTMQVDDEITGVSNIGSRTFFENVDTSRNGLEAALVFDITTGLKLTASYTYSDFEFDTSDPALNGNELPGLPEQTFYSELAYTHASGVYLIGDVLLVDNIYANNANTAASDAYAVANLRAGFSGHLGNWELSPFIGINNLFDEDYNGNLLLNARGRPGFETYYDPAPDLNFYGGLQARYNFR